MMASMTTATMMMMIQSRWMHQLFDMYFRECKFRKRLLIKTTCHFLGSSFESRLHKKYEPVWYADICVTRVAGLFASAYIRYQSEMRLQFACWFHTPVQIIWQLTMLSHYLTQSVQWLIYPLQLIFRVMLFWLNVNLIETPQDISPCGRIGRPSLFAFLVQSTCLSYA